MAIREVKEVNDKEQAESIVTSAKGTYAAVILMGPTGVRNSTISDVDVKANNARKDDPTVPGAYYVWFWCPAVDGEYSLSDKVYKRVNVPRYNEMGDEITYVAGDIIDINFDNGYVNAPRFVRAWCLVNQPDSEDILKSNISGIRTGHFFLSARDVIDLYSNMEDCPARNLYP